MEHNRKKKQQEKNPVINNEDGLTISYDKDELIKHFPNLLTEIKGKRKSVKIDSVKEYDNAFPRELANPGAIDFIRRCTSEEEALSILDYLLKRKEISTKKYESLKEEICQENGLQKLINRHGGLKRPGYYERKYRSNINNIREEKEEK